MAPYMVQRFSEHLGFDRLSGLRNRKTPPVPSPGRARPSQSVPTLGRNSSKPSIPVLKKAHSKPSTPILKKVRATSTPILKKIRASSATIYKKARSKIHVPVLKNRMNSTVPFLGRKRTRRDERRLKRNQANMWEPWQGNIRGEVPPPRRKHWRRLEKRIKRSNAIHRIDPKPVAGHDYPHDDRIRNPPLVRTYDPNQPDWAKLHSYRGWKPKGGVYYQDWYTGPPRRHTHSDEADVPQSSKGRSPAPGWIPTGPDTFHRAMAQKRQQQLTGRASIPVSVQRPHGYEQPPKPNFLKKAWMQRRGPSPNSSTRAELPVSQLEEKKLYSHPINRSLLSWENHWGISRRIRSDSPSSGSGGSVVGVASHFNPNHLVEQGVDPFTHPIFRESYLRETGRIPRKPRAHTQPGNASSPAFPTSQTPPTSRHTLSSHRVEQSAPSLTSLGKVQPPSLTGRASPAGSIGQRTSTSPVVGASSVLPARQLALNPIGAKPVESITSHSSLPNIRTGRAHSYFTTNQPSRLVGVGQSRPSSPNNSRDDWRRGSAGASVAE